MTPERAVATSLAFTAQGNFDALVKNRLPPADYAKWRSEWDAAHAQAAPVSEAQRKQFATIMQLLTEPGAEAKLATRLTPDLAKLRGHGNSLPIATSIFEAAGNQMIAESPQLGTAQRALAHQGLQALIGWLKDTDFSDPKKAKQAIDLVCATARQLHVKTLDQWRALDYATTMKDYGLIWNGLEQLLDIYGLNLARSFADAKVSATAVDGDHATVKLDLRLAGTPLSGAWPMVKQGGHWYDAALLEAWRKAHPASAATGASPAHSGTAAPEASSTGAGSRPAPTSAPAAAAPGESSDRPVGSHRLR